MSISIYQDHTVGPMVFCVDTDAPCSCIGDKALERIVRHSGRKSIPIIDSKYDFKFDNTTKRSRVIVELILLTPGSSLDIPVLLDFVDV